MLLVQLLFLHPWLH